MVTRDPGASIYLKIVAMIRAQIDEGTLAPDSPMPTEKALQHEYGVGVGTIRRVMKELRSAGLVFGEQGEVARVRRRYETVPYRVKRGSRVKFRAATADERRNLQLGVGIQIARVDFFGQIDELVLERTELIFN